MFKKKYIAKFLIVSILGFTASAYKQVWSSQNAESELSALFNDSQNWVKGSNMQEYKAHEENNTKPLYLQLSTEQFPITGYDSIRGMYFYDPEYHHNAILGIEPSSIKTLIKK